MLQNDRLSFLSCTILPQSSTHLFKFVSMKQNSSTSPRTNQIKNKSPSLGRLSSPPSQRYEASSRPYQTPKSSIKVRSESQRELTVEREHRADQVALASNNLQTIFNTQTISDVALLLLNHFLILRKSDLEAWEEDPEEWILEVTGDVVSAESGLRVLTVLMAKIDHRWLLNLYSRNL